MIARRVRVGFRTGVLLVALLPLAACEQLPAQLQNINFEQVSRFVQRGAAILEPMPVQQEILVGHEISAVLLGAAPLQRDDSLHRYVNRVGLWLATQTERPDLPWRFGVLNTDTVNAFAAPGGNIFVTRGLLAILDNEAELAGVLAHEIVHVLQRHHLDALRRDKAMGLATDLGRQFTSPELQSQASAIPDALKQKLAQAGKALYSKGLDRSDEIESDRLGVVIAIRAGYDPYAFVAVLQKLDALSANDSRLALLFKTHPSPTQRLEELAPAFDQLAPSGPFATGTRRYRRYALARI